MKKFRAVFFDLDGTLVDSVPMLTEAINRLMRRRARPEFTEQQVAEMVGKGTEALIESVCSAQGIEPTEENVRAFLTEYAGYLTGDDMPEERFYPGAQEAVRRIHDAGLKTALVTNKMRAITLHFMQKRGIVELFDVLVAGDDTPNPKPAPDMLLAAAEKLGVDIGDVLMVGDSENDALAARNAGASAALVETGYNGKVPVAQWAAQNGFDTVLPSVKEVADLVLGN